MGPQLIIVTKQAGFTQPWNRAEPILFIKFQEANEVIQDNAQSVAKSGRETLMERYLSF